MSVQVQIKRPVFSDIDHDAIETQLDQLLATSREQIAELEKIESAEWQNFMLPQQQIQDELSRFWSPVSHLNSVLNSESLRSAYNVCLPKLSQFNTELGQNQRLYELTEQLANSDEFATLSPARQTSVKNQLRDFKLSGVSLPETDKKRFMEIALRLAELRTRFSENVLDCSNAWSKLFTDEADLGGLPEHALHAAKARAESKSEQGWLLNLEFPTYYAVMTFADSEALRREMYTAWTTKASDEGPHDVKLDNAPLIEEILALRAERAALLGFSSYADLSVVTKMVESPQQVESFLRDLAARSRPRALEEMQELRQFASDTAGVSEINAWDVSYYSDKLKQQQYALSEEDLKPYFPADKAIPGMFAVVGKLFGLNIHEVDDVDVWHEDVRYFEITDQQGNKRGAFYMDNYARENKRGGAWMDICVSRRRTDEQQVQIPIAYLTCNLTPPVGDDPALLTHTEVTTLFHEFGHGLHHMLTLVDEPDVAGISGVEWDAVELPSQFLENWCWEREALDMISGHYQTGAKLPDELLEKAQRARHFQSAMQMVRQLEFALFDMRIHGQKQALSAAEVQQELDSVRAEVAVIPTPEFSRFQNGFSHVFAGGYAAGYFSYKWAEVLSADAFSRFEDEGIFNQSTGQEFMQKILEKGGTHDAMTLFVDFRGRKPEIQALLQQSGLAA